MTRKSLITLLSFTAGCFSALSPTSAGSDALPQIEVLLSQEVNSAARNLGAQFDTSLFPLQANSDRLKLTGEFDWRDIPFHLTEEMASKGAVLDIATTSDISVMPEMSALQVLINGKLTGVVQLGAGDRNGPVSIPIEQGTLVAGQNTLRLLIKHRHRVDCSLAATHELWTQIDPKRSGFRYQAHTPTISDINTMAAVRRRSDGTLPIRLILQNGSDPTTIAGAIQLAQRFALVARASSPDIRIFSESQNGPGLEVFAGHPGVIRSLRRGADSGETPPFGLSVAAGEEPGTAEIWTAYADPNELSAYVAALDKWLDERTERQITDQNRTSGIRPVTVMGGETFTFSELGIDTAEFAGRLARLRVQLRLPGDFLPADYGWADVDLGLGFAKGLIPENRFSVVVNQSPVAGTKIAKGSASDPFHSHKVRLPLSVFRPGVNELEFQIQALSDGDAICDPQVLMSSENRVVWLGSSKISFPELGRIGQLPQLSALAADGFPYGKRDASPTSLFVPYPDANSLSAAATLVSRMAVSQGAPFPFTLDIGGTYPQSKSAIIVGALQDIPTAVLQGVELDRTMLASAFEPVQKQVAELTLPAPGPAPATTGSLSTVTNTTVFTPEILKTGVQIQETWKTQHDQSTSPWDVFSALVSGGIEKASNTLASSGLPGGFAAPFSVDPDTNLFIAQSQNPETTEGTWTLVTSASSGLLRQSVLQLTSSNAWNTLSDGNASIGQDGVVTTSLRPELKYVAPGLPVTPGNLRRVLAGWFSQNPFVYFGLVLAAAALFGLMTDRVLKTVGPRSGSS